MRLLIYWLIAEVIGSAVAVLIVTTTGASETVGMLLGFAVGVVSATIAIALAEKHEDY